MATLEKLFNEEWRTQYTHSLDSQGVLEVHGFYGDYDFELKSGDLSCRGQITLPKVSPSITVERYHAQGLTRHTATMGPPL